MEKTYAEIFNANRVTWLYQIARSDVSPSAVKIALLFATFVVPESREDVSPSYSWIAKTSKLTRPTVGRCVQELVAAGYLDVTAAEGWKSCYSMPFTGEAEWLKPEPKSTRGV